jgi:hypothetical protein
MCRSRFRGVERKDYCVCDHCWFLKDVAPVLRLQARRRFENRWICHTYHSQISGVSRNLYAGGVTVSITLPKSMATACERGMWFAFHVIESVQL